MKTFIASSYLVQPREGHLDAVFHIFGYLKVHNRSTMVFDSQYVSWSDADFPEHDWTDFYPDITEDIPNNALKPRCMLMQSNAFIDASCAQNKITHR